MPNNTENMLDRLIKIIGDLIALLTRKPVGKFVVSFTVVTDNKIISHGGVEMPTLPPINVFSFQKQPMDLNPIPAGGTDVDEGIVATVTSSDPTQVGVEPDPAVQGGYFLTTPLDSGTATITISGANMETVDFVFSYKPFVAGTWNPVFGTPVGDAVTP